MLTLLPPTTLERVQKEGFCGQVATKFSLVFARPGTDLRGTLAASIIVARQLAQIGLRPSPAYEVAIANAITAAEKIMRRIDSKLSAPHQDGYF